MSQIVVYVINYVCQSDSLRRIDYHRIISLAIELLRLTRKYEASYPESNYYGVYAKRFSPYGRRP